MDRLDANDDSDDENGCLQRLDLSDAPVNGVERRIADACTQQEGDGATVASRELLEQMDSLATELSSFAARMVEMTGEAEEPSVSSPVESKSGALASGDDAVDPVPAPRVADADADPVHPPQALSALDLQASVALTNVHDNDTQLGLLRAASLPPPAYSRYQRLLRTNPAQPTPVSMSRRGGNRIDRAGAKPQLSARVREILSSPTLWREYQSKSFQIHIQRQQQARRLAEEEIAAAKTVTAARFKQAEYNLKLTARVGARPEDLRSSRSSASTTATYLKRFRRDLDKSPDAGATRSPSESVEMPDGLASGVLCGVYVYGNRRLGLAYFTCSTVAQLEERVRRHFRISTALNLYRERVSPFTRKRASSRARTLQRITTFKQIRDGDRLCVTQDSYEDMAILCDWIKQRQLRVYNMQSPHSAGTQSAPPLAPARSKSTVRNNDKANSHRTSLGTHRSETAMGLWDANGRSMAVKKKLEL